jgi:nucleoside-diphosphate-sugar epimerase
VRAVVRKEAQVDKIRATRSVKSHVSRLTFVVVPDFTDPHAWSPHGDDVSAVIHVASPLYSSPDRVVNVANFAAPVIKITQNILDFAARIDSIKTVVITSSVDTFSSDVATDGPSSLCYTSQESNLLVATKGTDLRHQTSPLSPPIPSTLFRQRHPNPEHMPLLRYSQLSSSVTTPSQERQTSR